MPDLPKCAFRLLFRTEPFFPDEHLGGCQLRPSLTKARRSIFDVALRPVPEQHGCRNALSQSSTPEILDRQGRRVALYWAVDVIAQQNALCTTTATLLHEYLNTCTLCATSAKYTTKNPADAKYTRPTARQPDLCMCVSIANNQWRVFFFLSGAVCLIRKKPFLRQLFTGQIPFSAIATCTSNIAVPRRQLLAIGCLVVRQKIIPIFKRYFFISLICQIFGDIINLDPAQKSDSDNFRHHPHIQEQFSFSFGWHFQNQPFLASPTSTPLSMHPERRHRDFARRHSYIHSHSLTPKAYHQRYILATYRLFRHFAHFTDRAVWT